jgi:hypothetical protein
MTDTRPFDPALFRDIAIYPETAIDDMPAFVPIRTGAEFVSAGTVF